MKTEYCIACEASDVKRIKKAKHFISKSGVKIGLCPKHYEEYKMEEEYNILKSDLQNGYCSTKD